MRIKLRVYRHCSTDLRIHMQKHSCTHAHTPCVSRQVCSCSVGVEVKKSCGFRQDGAARPKALAPSVLSPLTVDMYHHVPGRSQNRLHWTKMQNCPPLATYTHYSRKEKRKGKTPACCHDKKTDWEKKPNVLENEIYRRNMQKADVLCKLNAN